MTRWRKILLGLLIGAGALCLAAVLGAPGAARLLFVERNLDEPSPRLAVTDARGLERDLTAGMRLTFVDFAAVGCVPCMKDLPQLTTMWRNFSAQGKCDFALVLYGFEGEALADLAREWGVEDIPVYGYRGGSEIEKTVTVFPTKLLLRGNRILARQVGSVGMLRRIWEPVIRANVATSNSALQRTALRAAADRYRWTEEEER